MAVVIALLALMGLAAALRLAGLNGPDGRLTLDEARLALVGSGVLETGLPTLPTGRIYTRGLLGSYLIAASFAILGQHDFAAWLPSVVTGVLLVPATFLLGRLLFGALAGLAAAGFVALAWPLIDWSQKAWMPSPFLLLFTLAIYCWYRGFVRREGRWQVIGALALLLGVLAYEFAVLVLAGLGLYLALEVARGRRDWYLGRLTLLTWGIVALGLGLFGGLALALRAGTLAGPLGEVERWLAPDVTTIEGTRYYLGELFAPYAALMVAALVGFVPLLRAQPWGAAYVGILAALAFVVPSFVLQVKFAERYALPVLPLLAVLAAGGTLATARWIGQLGGPAPLRAALPALGLLLVFGLGLRDDLRATRGRLASSAPRETWVQVLERQDLGPDDLIVTDQAEKLSHYVGRVDFWIRPDAHERYAYRGPDGELRHVYTGAELLHAPGDFERLIEAAYPGRTVWLIGRRATMLDQLDGVSPELWPSLTAAGKKTETRDDWVLLRLTVPRRVKG